MSVCFYNLNKLLLYLYNHKNLQYRTFRIDCSFRPKVSIAIVQIIVLVRDAQNQNILLFCRRKGIMPLQSHIGPLSPKPVLASFYDDDIKKSLILIQQEHNRTVYVTGYGKLYEMDTETKQAACNTGLYSSRLLGCAGLFSFE
jgi:hypothetical protein